MSWAAHGADGFWPFSPPGPYNVNKIGYLNSTVDCLVTAKNCHCPKSVEAD